MKRFITVLALVAAIAAVAAPYLIGLRVETLFHQHVARLSAQTGYPIDVVRYERGWLHAQAVTRIDLPDDVTITLQHRITHGPYAVFAWATVKTTPRFNDIPMLTYFFGDKPPVTITTRFAFDGTVITHARSPAFSKTTRARPDRTVTWGGAEAAVRFDGERLHYRLTAPKLALSGPDGRLSITGTRLTGSGGRGVRPGQSPTAINWHTQTRARIQEFVLRSKDLHARASLSWQVETGLNQDDDYGADFRLQIANAVFRAPWDNSAKPFKLDKALVNIALHGIDTQALAQLLRDIGSRRSQRGTTPPATPNRLPAVVLGHLPALLSQDTELIAEIPAFDSNRGQLGLRGHATLGPPQSGNTILPPAIKLLQRLNISLHAFADSPLLHMALGSRADVLNSLVERQWLELEDGRYTVRMHFGPQRFSINGRPAQRLLGGLLGAL